MVFDVAHISLPYNVILDYPALAQFMAVAHHVYNLDKIPGSNGTITIRCDEADARRAMEHVYKAAAAASLDEDDLLEHPGGFPSKKATSAQDLIEHTGGSPSAGSYVTPYLAKHTGGSGERTPPASQGSTGRNSAKLQSAPQGRPPTVSDPSPSTPKYSARNGPGTASSIKARNLAEDFDTTLSFRNRSPRT